MPAMEWFIAVLAVAALGVAAMAAAGGMGQMSRDPVQDTFWPTLPDRPLSKADLLGLRFGVAFRGYSMAQVDDVLDRLGREIEARDARIAELRAPFAASGEGWQPDAMFPEPVQGPEPANPLPELVEGREEPAPRADTANVVPPQAGRP